MKKFEVKVDREFVLTKTIRGVEVAKSTGWMYVDVFFPDGSQRMCGYIGKALDGPFAPLSGCDRDLAKKIQDEINKIAGRTEDAPPPPDIIEESDEFAG